MLEDNFDDTRIDYKYSLSLSVGLFVCSTDCLFVCLSLPDYIFASQSLSTYLSLFLDFTELFHSANYTAILAHIATFLVLHSTPKALALAWAS